MHLHLFGASTPAGESFKRHIIDCQLSSDLFCYSRSDLSLFPVDFKEPDSFLPRGVFGSPSVWISFAPIWLLAPFLDRIAQMYPDRIAGLHGLIACSSSSVITKRYASNSFDRDLVKRLSTAESQLIAICKHLKVSCGILRPTLIYGRVGPYVDQNLSRLISLMRRVPLLPLPVDTGLRQPIHASQLAAVALELVRQIIAGRFDPELPKCIALGGDSELNYTAMLQALQLSLPHADPARRCRLIPFPNRLFYAAAAPLLLQSPQAFEAIMRMGSDLSGFTPAHQLLKAHPQPFPVVPPL